jgi:phosphopantothenoylcysteine decarboxylase/phosphopantothenate--cysteine ligase
MYLLKQWDFKKKITNDHALGDLEIAASEMSNLLQGFHIALMITGSISAYKTPNLVRALRRLGATITIYLSEQACRFVAIDALMWCNGGKEVISHLSPRAEHVSTQIDLYLVVPATYETINGFANGSAHTTILATLAAGLGRLEQGKSEIILAPAMNGDMCNTILLSSLEKLRDLGVQILEPRWHTDNKLNLPEEDRICAFALKALLSRKSNLLSKKVLVTAGAIPVYLDGVRLITNPFSGKLGIEIAKYLSFLGADVHLVLGPTHAFVPEYLQVYHVKDLNAYQQIVHQLSENTEIGIYSAGVADFAPQQVINAKVSSDQQHWQIDLYATPKIIEEIRHAYPNQYMVTFKYMQKIELEALFEIGRKRLLSYEMLVVNRGEEQENGQQVAYLMQRNQETQQKPMKMVGKFPIAQALVNALNQHFEKEKTSF